MSKHAEEKLTKWCTWASEIRKETYELLHKKQVFDVYRKALDEVIKLGHPLVFHGWLLDNFRDSLLAGIRRQVTPKKQSGASIAKLLDEILNDPRTLTRDWHISLWKTPSDYGGDLDHLFTQGGYINASIVEDDLNSLKSLGKRSKDYFDKYVGHRDKNRAKFNLPTYDEICTFFDEYKGLVEKYLELFTAQGYLLTPIIGIDWEEKTFYEPWLNRRPPPLSSTNYSDPKG